MKIKSFRPLLVITLLALAASQLSSLKAESNPSQQEVTYIQMDGYVKDSEGNAYCDETASGATVEIQKGKTIGIMLTSTGIAASWTHTLPVGNYIKPIAISHSENYTDPTDLSDTPYQYADGTLAKNDDGSTYYPQKPLTDVKLLSLPEQEDALYFRAVGATPSDAPVMILLKRGTRSLMINVVVTD